MPTTNAHGQQIGDPIPDWTPRPRPKPVTLRGRYVDVVPVGAVDPPALYAEIAGQANADLWTYFPDDPPLAPAEFAQRVVTWSQSPAAVTFSLVADNVPCGIASLMRIDAANGVVEIGAIMLGPRLKRTRAATEAMALLMRHVFEDLGYRRYEWKLDALNTASADAARRLGFTYEGRFRQAVVYKGRNRDTDWFAMTDADWSRLRPAYDRWLDPANFDDAGRQRRSLRELTV